MINICVLALTAALVAGSAAGQIIMPTSPGNTGAAPNGIAATTNLLLFTQPFCAGMQTRGIYSANPSTGASKLMTSFTGANTNLNVCAENYLAISPGLGGFKAGDTYATAASPTTASEVAVLKNGVLFIDHITSPKMHAGVTFDSAGTFSGALIVTAPGAIRGFDASGTLLFSYPTLGTLVLEGATVAPLTYAPCPGCLYITAEQMADVDNANPTGPGEILRVLPGTPSGTAASFFSTTPGPEPEGLEFVTVRSLSCTNSKFDYFVSGYATGGQINTPKATNGAILEYTPAQLAPFEGQFLVPDEVTKNIYAFSDGAWTVFASTAYQLEGAAMLTCPSSPGRMTGGGSVFESDGTRVTHGFELHCDPADVPNTLEINWGSENRFHLDTLISAFCFTDPNIDSGHPPAPFNTYVGAGTGSFNGVPGATANWLFTDAGEPGNHDTATISVRDANGNTVLTVSGTLDSGNQQAHNDNK
jgi:hypothetical protein